MVLKIAERGVIPPFIVMDVMRAANERAATGKDVLHLEVGQPSTSAPKAVIEAAKKALDQDLLGYTDALGVPPLRERLAAYYKDYYNVTIPVEQIIITTGSSGAFMLSFLAVFDHGDKVGLASPSYPAYRNILRALGVEVVDIPVGLETAFQPTAEILEKLDVDLDGLIIASPSNPTGSMLSAEALEGIVKWCDASGVRLISDEIYHGITYEGKANTALSYGDNAIIVNSFSKYFSMTGWRLGWMIVPENLIRASECLAQNLFISPPTLSQLATISVFDCFDELDANVARYAENRALLLNELPKAGLDRLAPSDGAFYVYADVTRYTNDSQVFCKKVLAETGVAITPGIDFDTERGSQYVRFSFAGATEDMVEAANRLGEFLA
ncbi:MAG: pyridoxal phosphate-dependent aminotransferase [Rhodospirillaceae bacterium]|jgi:aspartate/methionine/tyrosine aminotransferase|nr:pyridoxal phosphate-dependent aminotransferase [Rhodospirillaceae bacterium]MBT4588059.1 pyridoxal phosphate-dependent aminotransferase [Rhodospirillaceae bacterium]MBT4941220.1 pyridoxal phosphate-dependent aminotransferase [Rhodospirillaceae bacterium]MBT7266657.1 pyridoxal phosphate-dependent aminotransferase [Rhodospirillaceae bacterium]